ncbi:MAG TPA: class I SAM-dependent methyltransferase [Sphingomicrobium sp.]
MFDTYSEIFAKRGAAYQQAMAECPNAREAEFAAVLEPLAGRSGVLCDLPSGGGYLASRLPAGMRYVGVDPSDDFVRACPVGIECIQAPITRVPLADGAVDAVVSLAALHHEPDLPAVFSEMRRLLRPGGRAVIADAQAGTPVATFLNGFVDRHNPMGHVGIFLDERTAGLIEAAGFTIADDAVVAMPWRFDSMEEAGGFCRLLFSMPDLDAAAVADAMYRQLGFDTIDGRPHLRWALRRIVADARQTSIMGVL